MTRSVDEQIEAAQEQMLRHHLEHIAPMSADPRQSPAIERHMSRPEPSIVRTWALVALVIGMVIGIVLGSV